MNRVYSWRKHHNADAQAVGEWVESLSDSSPENILKLAQKKTCPAHDVFNWDNDEAARQFRLVQARVMVRSLKVEVINKKKEVISMDAFITSSDRGGYVPIFDATDEELTAAEERFLDLIARLEKRYEDLEVAIPVIAAIRRVRKSTARRKKKAA